MSGVERLMFGSTAEYVLRRADVSVIVVPPHWTAPRPASTDLSGLGPIVAGIDFSASSVLAAGAAAWFADALHTSMELVHVVPALPVLRRWQAHADSSMKARVEEARRELTSIAKDLGSRVPVQTRVEVGHVAETLAAVVDTDDEQRRMLLLGRSGGGSRGTPPGAIAYRVLMLSAVPAFVYLPQP
jgi:nucleotide-binding universal stress UspA family protein